jgi:imidazolonepropionase-like amidohydrolase
MVGKMTRLPAYLEGVMDMAAAILTDRPRLTALRAGWMFDGMSTVLLPDPVVVIDDTRILSVGQRIVPPAGADVVDLGAATLLPGLVDTHVHLGFDASWDPVAHLAARTDEEVQAAMREAGRAALRGGVTTVRDLGDRDYLSLQLRGEPDLPTIVAAGPPITTLGGHCHFLGGTAQPGEAGVRAAVREHAQRGADVIKIMASGGTLTPGTHQESAQFTAGELRAAVEEAHRLGLPITAHVHATQAIADAVAAGVDGMEHVSFWSADGVDEPAELIELIGRRRIVIGATVGQLPVAGATPPPEVLRRLPFIIANTRRLRQAGAPIVAGTDAGIAPVKPPDALRYSLPQLTELDMTAAEALRAVTSVAAGVCRLGQRKGRIAAGYDADLLVVDGDPLTDPDAIHRIRAVYRNGQGVNRSDSSPRPTAPQRGG